MNQGGEPGHDDYGLPPVDIEIPDDARELDRDVQAYHRELRAMRRHERSRRWRAPLRKSGMIVPLIAGGLVLAMVAGMVLTMFSANPYFSGLGGQRPQSPGFQASGRTSGLSAAPSAARSASTGTAGQAGAQLAGKTISVGGKRVAITALTGSALAIVPADCRCAAVVQRLLAQAASAGIKVYLVGKRGSQTELSRLTPTSARGTAFVAIDADNALNSAYRPTGLMILLIDSYGHVMVGPTLSPGFRLEQKLRSLRPAPSPPSTP